MCFVIVDTGHLSFSYVSYNLLVQVSVHLSSLVCDYGSGFFDFVGWGQEAILLMAAREQVKEELV